MPLYRATISGIYHGQSIMNVIHFADNIAQGGVPPTPQFIAEDLAANWIPAVRILHHNAFTYVQIECIEIRNPAPMPAHITLVNLPGNGGSSQSHSVSAFKFRWITTRGGRRGFGKMYLGGIEASLLSANYTPTTTCLDRVNTFLAGIEGRYMAHDFGAPVPFRMMLVHKDANDPPNEITTATFYPVVGTQRRRNKLVGV